MKLSNY